MPTAVLVAESSTWSSLSHVNLSSPSDSVTVNLFRVRLSSLYQQHAFITEHHLWYLREDPEKSEQREFCDQKQCQDEVNFSTLKLCGELFSTFITCLPIIVNIDTHNDSDTLCCLINCRTITITDFKLFTFRISLAGSVACWNPSVSLDDAVKTAMF